MVKDEDILTSVRYGFRQTYFSTLTQLESLPLPMSGTTASVAPNRKGKLQYIEFVLVTPPLCCVVQMKMKRRRNYDL